MNPPQHRGGAAVPPPPSTARHLPEADAPQAEPRPPHRWKLAVAILVICVLAGLVVVWGHRFPPLQDYPIWLYESSLAASSERREALGVERAPFPAWSSANTWIIAAMTPWLGVETAGRVFLTLIVSVLGAGTFALLRAFRSSPGSWPVLLLVPGYFFFHGNLNFVLGLGFLYGGMAHVVSRRVGRWPPVVPGLVSLVLYFCHAAVLAAWFAFLAGALLRPRMRGRLRLVLGQVPVLLLCGWMLAVWSPPAALAPPTGASGSPGVWVRSKVSGVVQAVAPFQVFDAVDPMDGGLRFLLAAANALLVALSVGLALAGLRRLAGSRETRWMLVPVLAYSLAFLVIPWYFQGVYDLGMRFLPPLVLVLVANAAVGAFSRTIGGVTAVAAAGLLLYAATDVSRVGAELEAVHGTMTQIDPLGRGQLVDVWLFDYRGLEAPARPPVPERLLLPRHEPLGRVLYYLKIASGEPAPIWGTGLLRGSPLTFPIVSSVESLRSRSTPERLWIVGPRDRRDAIARALGPRYLVGADRRAVTLLTPAGD